MPGGGSKTCKMKTIRMVDLQGQYQRIKPEVDLAIQSVLEAADFIQGSSVRQFETDLSRYLGGVHVVSCGNGTDALQIAMMGLNFQRGGEVILPVHTYVATAEVIALLGLVPVFVDVDEETFTMDITQVEQNITPRTVAIVPVHLYGQCANMEPLLALADKHRVAVIEDAAQALGAQYQFADGRSSKAGTLGILGATSFFPSKNLGAFGDGGAMFTRDESLANKVRMIANHGQSIKYHHDLIGVNSRLDTLQAAVLRVKLTYLKSFEKSRRKVADYYDAHLSGIDGITIPARAHYSSHVFHQYTLKVEGTERDRLKVYLEERGVPTMIYYPIPLHFQPPYRQGGRETGAFPVSEKLSQTVISLPIHTEMEEDQLSYICDSIQQFFR